MSDNEIFVARQPIFDRSRRVQGYELLFRKSLENVARVSDGRAATGHVLSASYLDIGLEQLTAGMPAFINFGRELLLDGTPQTMPPDQVVIEILEDVVPDEEILQSVRDLKRKGYRFAIDDFTGNSAFGPLIPLVDIVKIDFLGLEKNRMSEIVRAVRSNQGHNLTLLAEKVENHGQLADARLQGFDLFQGYFFSTPEVLQSTRIPESKIAHLKLLQIFQDPAINYKRMEEIIKSDVALTAKLLKYINAAAFPWAGRVQSIKHALVLLGENNIRRWVSLVALAEMTRDKPYELAVTSSCRGRFCELAGDAVDRAHSELEHFLLGALSTLDAMLDVPMELALAPLPISSELKSALCGESSTLRNLLDLATSYERGDWRRLAPLCRQANLSEQALPALYREALVWSDRVLRN
ncbi:MAG: EAL domain-containing protein [Acidobacteriota bacterium]